LSALAAWVRVRLGVEVIWYTALMDLQSRTILQAGLRAQLILFENRRQGDRAETMKRGSE
jgi:hypothetical protein